MAKQTIAVQLTWEDVSTGDFEETGQEVDVYTDSPSFIPTVELDYNDARHTWMRLPAIAAGEESATIELRTPVTFVEFRVRQYNANGAGEWSLVRRVSVAQSAGVTVPTAPVNLGAVVVSGGVPPPPPPIDPPPPPPPTGGGGSSSNYDAASQFSGVQGQNQWSYLDTSGGNLTYAPANNIWNGPQLYQTIWPGGGHPGATSGVVLRWTAPTGGTAIVTGVVNLVTTGGNGIVFTLKHNAAAIDGPIALTDTSVRSLSETVVVLSGDHLDFIIESNGSVTYDSAVLAPIIQLTTDGSTPAPPALSTLSPATMALSVGGIGSLTVSLSSVTPSAASIATASSDPTKATVPSSVSIPAGQISTTLSVTGVAVGGSTISATYGGAQRTSVVTVSSPPSGSWVNAPQGGVVLLDHSFNSMVAAGLFTPWNNTFIVSDASAPFTPSNVARQRLEAFAKTGGDELAYTSPTNYREMYMGVYWRTNPQFQGRISSNKLFFLRGIPGTNGVIYMTGGPNMGQANFSLVWSHNSGHLNNGHIMGGDQFGSTAFANVGSAVVVPGLWYKIELHIRASTTSSSRDGFMRMWLNNSLTHSYDQLNYAAATATMSTPGFLNQWVWSETWDGSGDMGISNTVPWEHYVDHVYIVGKN